MFFKKLKNKDLSELQKRNALINQYILIAQALELQKRVWLQEVIKELGLDERKSWNVDSNSGKITELITPKIEVQKNEPQTNQRNPK